MQTFKLALAIFGIFILLPIVIFLIIGVFGTSGLKGLLLAAVALITAFSK